MEKIDVIGVIHSPLTKLGDCPLQENENAPGAVVEIFPAYAQGTKDLCTGDKIILLTWLHKANRDVLVTHPRNDTNNPLTGIFSTRSPDRPNPIGIHFLTIGSVLSENKFEVSGLEVLDNTPVIDIKPAR